MVMIFPSSGSEVIATPLGTLCFAVVVVCAPWLFQRSQNRNSSMGTSPMDESSERFFRRAATVATCALVAAALLAKGLGWIPTWTEW